MSESLIKSKGQVVINIGSANKLNLTEVTVSLSEPFTNYDYIYVSSAYYSNGVASYGGHLIPTRLASTIYSTDAGDRFNVGDVKVRVLFNVQNNTVKFKSSENVEGNYYVVHGIKVR